MEKLRLKFHKPPRKRKGKAEEIELRETTKRSASDKTEHPQESTLTKSSESTTLEDSLVESWVLVEAPEPDKLQTQSRSSPEIKESEKRAVKSSASFEEEKPENPVIRIYKQLIKQTVTSPRFYSSWGDNGYLVELKFACKSTKSHRNKVYIYTFIQAGKNDSQLMWPLRTTVQLLFIDHEGDTM